MINHKVLLSRIDEVLNPNIDDSIRVQIARRILAQSFIEVLGARKSNSKVSSLSGPDFKIDFDRRRFFGSRKLLIKAYLELIYLFLQYVLIIVWKHPNLKTQQPNELNLFFGYHFPTTPLEECEQHVSEYLRSFSTSQGLGSIFFIEQGKHFRKPQGIQSSFFSFSPVLSALIATKCFSFRFYALFRLLLEFSYFFLLIPFLGCKQLVVRDLFMQKWLVDVFVRQGTDVQLFCTPNNLFTQNLMFTKIAPTGSRNMIWYSASALKRDFEDEWYIDESLYFNLPIDCHYVWTQDHATFLEQSGNCKVKVVGPQLFYLPSTNLNENMRKKTIAVMDVTPTSWSLYSNTLYGVNRGLWFLDQIHSALFDLERIGNSIRVEFKFKRDLANHHSREYADKVQSLTDLGLFSLIDANINLFDYLSRVDCLITTELTSVGLVAESLGVDVMYLDPFSTSMKDGPFYPRNSSELKSLIRNRKTLL
ncbi:hypothetical protein MCEMRE226_00034 [Candidatus Nanopelagicaceae bacterium]